jgi:hypothetical protein
MDHPIIREKNYAVYIKTAYLQIFCCSLKCKCKKVVSFEIVITHDCPVILQVVTVFQTRELKHQTP